LKEEALDRTQWRTRFGRGYGPVVRKTTAWMTTHCSNARIPTLLKNSLNIGEPVYIPHLARSCAAPTFLQTLNLYGVTSQKYTLLTVEFSNFGMQMALYKFWPHKICKINLQIMHCNSCNSQYQNVSHKIIGIFIIYLHSNCVVH
jgi:hypothetical protein